MKRENANIDAGWDSSGESRVLDQLMTKEGSPAVGGYDDKLRAAFGLPQKQFGFDAMPGGRSNTQSIPHAKGSKGLLRWVTANGHPIFIWGSLKALTKVCYISLSMATLILTTTTTAVTQGTPLFDQEHITIAGRTWGVENANQPWSTNELGPNDFRFELRSGDIWPNPGGFTERTEIFGAYWEIYGGYLIPPGTTVSVCYDFMLEPGDANIAPWLVIGQWHSDFNPAITQPVHPPLAIYMFGNDQIQIGGVYAATGSTDETDLTLYADPNPLERGRFYSLKIVANFQNDETGFAQVWRDGIQIVDYSGPLGYGQAVYWKEGIYRYPTNQTIAARYQNTILTSDLCFAEGMPVLRLDDYGNPVFLLVPCNDGAATVVAPERPDTVRVLRELR